MKINFAKIFSFVSHYFLMFLGAAIYAIGIQLFFVPMKLVSGGMTGIAMIINLLTLYPIGAIIIVLNIPIFLIALKKFGFKFMLQSIIGMLASSLFIDLFSTIDLQLTSDPLLYAIYGGITTGIGSGLFFRLGGSGGGTDVVAKILRVRYPYINFGTCILFINAGIVIAYAIIFRDYEKAMYSVISLFVYTKVIDVVLYGPSQSKLCYIISEHSEEIKTAIVKTLHRGVTVINGKGAYSGTDKQVLLCVVKRHQIVDIRRLIRGIDQQSFLIVSDAREVFGRGFDNILEDK